MRPHKKQTPEVRLELTTYRLTAGRATDCAIQELVKTKMQSVGIEPTLLRTCALSMRLNHSAKTAVTREFGWCSWLSRQSNTLEVASSILASNIFSNKLGWLSW